MHVPDGYLSPQTYLRLLGGILACWFMALGRMKVQLAAQQVPNLARVNLIHRPGARQP